MTSAARKRDKTILQVGLTKAEREKIKALARTEERSMTAQVTVWLRERLEQETTRLEQI